MVLLESLTQIQNDRQKQQHQQLGQQDLLENGLTHLKCLEEWTDRRLTGRPQRSASAVGRS